MLLEEDCFQRRPALFPGVGRRTKDTEAEVLPQTLPQRSGNWSSVVFLGELPSVFVRAEQARESCLDLGVICQFSRGKNTKNTTVFPVPKDCTPTHQAKLCQVGRNDWAVCGLQMSNLGGAQIEYSSHHLPMSNSEKHDNKIM